MTANNRLSRKYFCIEYTSETKSMLRISKTKDIKELLGKVTRFDITVQKLEYRTRPIYPRTFNNKNSFATSASLDNASSMCASLQYCNIVGMGKVKLSDVLELFQSSKFRIQNFESVLMKFKALWQNNTTKYITAEC